MISSACSELAVSRGNELFILNRSISKKHPVPEGAVLLTGDVKADEVHLSKLLAGQHFDAVVDFIAYTVEDIERDITLFRGKTDQFVFISLLQPIKSPRRITSLLKKRRLKIPFGSIHAIRLPARNA